MLPAMQARIGTIQAAQRARGLDSEGSLLKRMRSISPLVAPLVLGTFSEIEHRAIALELRGFHSRNVQTSLREVPDSPTQQVMRWLMMVASILLMIRKLTT